MGDKRDLVEKKERSREPVLFYKKFSGIPAPGIPSDWLLLTVYINTLSV